MGLDKVDGNGVKAAVLRAWWLPLALVAVSFMLMLGGEASRLGFRFDRSAIQSGELWRLLTGHFVHLGGPHFALNAAGLALVWYLVGRTFDWQRWLLIAATCILTMDAGLWFLNPRLEWYVGLSGLLHGLLAAGLTERLRRPDTETLLLSALLVGKLLWEQLSGPIPGSEGTAGGPVVVDAHLFGALGGGLTAIVLRISTRPAAPI